MRSDSIPNDSLGILLYVLPVIVMWGCNFAVMRIGVGEVGPFTLGAMRFAVASVPFLLFIRPPAVPALFVLAYGATVGLGQFGFLFFAIHSGLSSGLASLLLQLQAVFTPLLALAVLKDRIPAPTIVATVVSLIGLGVIISAVNDTPAGTVPILLGVAAAFSWALSNVVVSWGARHGYRYDSIALIVWASAALPIPFAAMAAFSGEAQSWSFSVLQQAFLPALYLGLLATLVCNFLWIAAISKYSAAAVAPFSLLIPMIGLAIGWLVFGETLDRVRIVGCGLVVGGVFIHIIGTRLMSKRRQRHA